MARARLSILAVLLYVPAAAAGTRYVDAALASGANDGSSWSNAFRGPGGLQAALASALPDDELWVARGSYLPSLSGDRAASFVLRSRVAVYGGFAGGETQLDQRDVAAHPAVLDGDLAGDDAAGGVVDNSFHVVSGGTAGIRGILDGFVVRGGSADTSGGGYLSFLGSPTIRNCTFRANRAASSGGGLYLAQQAGGVFERCRFESNVAPRGGGAELSSAQPVSFRQCVFIGNVSTGNQAGGALFVSATPVELASCTVTGNSAVGGNIAGVNGGGFTTIVNSIVAGNHGSTIHLDAYQASASWSCIGWGPGGTGVFSADPRFLDAAAGDLRLAPTSPCVDAGANGLVPGSAATDLAGGPRFVDQPGMPDVGAGPGPLVDLGAFEVQMPLQSAFCAGDGTNGACPCGNTGFATRGCDNSARGTPGALLAGIGTTVPDTVSVHATGLAPGALCLLLQGDATAAGSSFGDGIACLAGRLLRMYQRTSAAGELVLPDAGAGDLPLRARSAALGDTIAPGQVRYYQLVYRDLAPAFCPAPVGGAWNVTNGLVMHW